MFLHFSCGVFFSGCQDISLSTFKRLRPQHILTVKHLKRTSCVCKTCANVAQKLEALQPLCKAVGVELSVSPKEALDRTLCQDGDRIKKLTCAQRRCEDCGVELLLSALESLPQDKIVSWFQWQVEAMEGTTKRMNNITKQVCLFWVFLSKKECPSAPLLFQSLAFGHWLIPFFYFYLRHCPWLVNCPC